MFGLFDNMDMLKPFFEVAKKKLVKAGIKTVFVKTLPTGELAVRAFKYPLCIITVQMLEEIKSLDENLYNRIEKINNPDNNDTSDK